jgi:uncharacterized protein YjbJ (UPF0337 family)
MNAPSSTDAKNRGLVADCDGTLTMALNYQAYDPQSRACSDVTRRYAMDWNRVEGNWKQIKGKVKEKWGDLTDDDLDKIAGRRDQLEGKIQERYGITKDQVRQDVDDWMNAQG